MAIPTLSGSYIDETYIRLVQVSGSEFSDGLGNTISFGPGSLSGGIDGYIPIWSGSIALSNSIISQTTNRLNVSGSLNVTGGITGSLAGTASLALNALTASYINPTFISASAAASGFGSGGNVNTASFATTGSNTFIGNQTITGSIIFNSGSQITSTYYGNAYPGYINIVAGAPNGFVELLSYNASSSFYIDDYGAYITTNSSSLFNLWEFRNDGRLLAPRGIEAPSFTGSFSGTVVGYVANTQTSSFVTNNQTGSFVTNTQTSSFVTNNQTGSFVTNTQTSSFVTNNQTSSFVTNSQTSSFVLNTQTGSMLSPYTLNSQTSSFVTNNQTSSFVTNSQTSSFIRNTQTGSFATTGSNIFRGNQTITGSLIISGSNTFIGSNTNWKPGLLNVSTNSDKSVATSSVFVLSTTENGTGSVYPQQLVFDYLGSGSGWGIQSVNQGVIQTPLYLNRNGGNVYIGQNTLVDLNVFGNINASNLTVGNSVTAESIDNPSINIFNFTNFI